MDIYENIMKINLNECYTREIFGLGEIYEIMSVEKIRRKLLEKFGEGRLYLVSNSEHGGRGESLNELKKKLIEKGLEINDSGFCDSPPWPSAPVQDGKKKNYSKIVISFAKIVFFLLVRVEWLWENPKNSHMIYCLSNK